MTDTQTSAETYVAGVDLGGRNVMAAVVKTSGEIVSGAEVVARAKKKCKGKRGPKEITGLCCAAVLKAAKSANIAKEQIKGVGIGAPGTIDGENGVVVFAPNLEDFENVPMKQMMEDELGIPTFLDNDVNVGVLGEATLGVGKGVSSIVGLFVGTGIGGGIILNGKLWRGFNFTAAEVGHITVSQKGPTCGCGAIGCMEAWASRTGIVRRIERAHKKGKETIVGKLCDGDFSKVGSSILAQAVEAEDKVTLKSLAKAWKMLGIGIASIVHLISPEMIILGGGVMEALGDGPVAEVEAIVRARTLPHTMDNVRVVRAALGDDAGILGAAMLAQTELGNG